jgi:hypothetical protein
MDRESFLKDLSEMNDFESLIHLNSAVFGEARDAVQKRMLAVLPSILPQIKDFETLSRYWHKVYMRSRILIEKRMAEVLSQINDLKVLYDYRSIVYGLGPISRGKEILLEKRIKEILDAKQLKP